MQHEITEQSASSSKESSNKMESPIDESKQLNDGVHLMNNSAGYRYPAEPAVRKRLESFMQLKLGLMIHWSPATQLGSIESWPLCDGDGDWSQREIDWTDRETFKQQYWDTPKTFNPVKFDPEKWAKIAKECGFRYVVFTSKHHDGFCMYDSAYSDYKITNPLCPFSKNPKADILKEVIDAFRKEGMAISVYYSKPDWHHEDFWSPDFGKPTTRHANYDPSKHPEHWNRYVDFVHDQLTELCANYGEIDVLWLDGSWIRPEINHQDIRLSEIVKKIRNTTQPHLIVVDRTVGGENENILTPEQTVPETQMSVPWESCISIGKGFSFHYEEELKTSYKLIHLFIDIISKGGNLALNITPQPDGSLPHAQVHTLRRFGRWVRANEKAIYRSKISPCRGNMAIRYTRVDDTDFAFFLYPQDPIMPNTLILNVEEGKKVNSVHHVRTNDALDFKQDGTKLVVDTSDLSMLHAEAAECFEISYC